MRTRKLRVYFFTVLALFAGPTGFAANKEELKPPEAGNIQMITTEDGSTNFGRITEAGETEIRFETSFGSIVIPVSMIKEVKEIPDTAIKKGDYWFPNPNKTRLYFSPTGRLLAKGEGYFSDYYLFFPGCTYGVTDNFTFGGGASLFPGTNLNQQMLYVTPKIGIKKSEHFNLAAGALVIKLPNFSSEEENTQIYDENGNPIPADQTSEDDLFEDGDEIHTVGVFYGVGTYGTPDQSFTLGLGYGFAGHNWADKPMVVVGGEKRLSPRTAFVTENWIFPAIKYPLVSYGIRFFGENISVDLAFLNFLGGGMTLFPGIPYVDFVVNF